ncbi:MAG: hypothetical protein QXI37_01930, partial [Thermoprotei archaeon]
MIRSADSPNVKSRLTLLLGILALEKVAIACVLTASSHGGVAGLETLVDRWDAVLYIQIAEKGYSNSFSSELYAFSPFYPALIYLVHFLAGSYSLASALVSNIFSAATVVAFYYALGYRGALLASIFPTFAYYSTAGYSDSLALFFLACGIIFYRKGRYLRTGVMFGCATVVLYSVALAAIPLAAGLLLHRGGSRLSAAASMFLPVLAAGLSVLGGYYLATGDATLWFRLQASIWGTQYTSPVGQAVWLLNLNGKGWFTQQDWQVLGLRLTPLYWFIRNVVFEAFYIVGAALLMRSKDSTDHVLGYMVLVVSIPLLFVIGTPAASVPRLLLPGFPAFKAYGNGTLSGKLTF